MLGVTTYVTTYVTIYVTIHVTTDGTKMYWNDISLRKCVSSFFFFWSVWTMKRPVTSVIPYKWPNFTVQYSVYIPQPAKAFPFVFTASAMNVAAAGASDQERLKTSNPFFHIPQFSLLSWRYFLIYTYIYISKDNFHIHTMHLVFFFRRWTSLTVWRLTTHIWVVAHR